MNARVPLTVRWEERLVDRLPLGMTIVTVPISGGSSRSWERLVAEVQRAAGSGRSDGQIHFVGEFHGQSLNALQVGVYGTELDCSPLADFLRSAAAVANANADRGVVPAPSQALLRSTAPCVPPPRVPPPVRRRAVGTS